MLCNFRPPVAPSRVELKDEKLFFRGDVAAANVRAKIVEPSEPAALAGSLEACTTGEGVPSAFAMVSDVVYKYEVLVDGPWASS